MYQWPRTYLKTTSLSANKVLGSGIRFLILGLVIWSTSTLAGAQQPVEPDMDPSDDVLNVSADRFSLDIPENKTTAHGNVTLSYRNMLLNADEVRYDRKSLAAWAEGNVTLISGKDRLSGDRMTLDLERETGVLENGFVFMDQNHIYLKADEIRKTGVDTYTASQATLTPCDGEKPDWRITGKHLKITVEGYGFAKHATFWAKQVPLLYTPFLVFPVKTKRQSGLLLPEISYSANRKGVQYLQPLYWAINKSSDATFYAEYISLRGLRLGTEYRYALGPRTSGAAIIDGFNDRQVDDGAGDSSASWGYDDDTPLRPNSDRYWLRAKADQPMPWGAHAKLDLDLVSDQDYLYEFKDGGLGFYQSRRFFRETYGRDLDDEHSGLRLNQLNLNKTWYHFSANGDLRWHDDVVQRRQEEIQNTVHHLPALSLNAVTQPIGTFGLYYALGASYDRLFRIDGDRAHRGLLNTEVSYPLHLFKGLSIVPSAGWNQTFWHIDHREAGSELENDQYARSLYSLKLNMQSDLFRVYQAAANPQSSLRHIIQPQLTYSFVSQNDSSDWPEFDALDRIEPQNKVTYALTNTWIRRRIASTPFDNQVPGGELKIRFKIQQSFDIDKHNNDDPRAFSDIQGELDLALGQNLLVKTDATWSPYDNAINALRASGYLKNTKGDSLGLDYRFARYLDPVQDSQTLIIKGVWQFTERWQLRGVHERNLASDENIATGFGFSYFAQCWSFDLDYSEEADDRSIMVKVQLSGL